jgi:hypothetical protein
MHRETRRGAGAYNYIPESRQGKKRILIDLDGLPLPDFSQLD